MRRRTVLGLGAAILGAGARLLAAAKVPRPAPEFVITLNSGEQLLLSKYRGKVVVLEMLLTTCPHCQRCAQTVQKVLEEYGQRGVQALGAAINDNARMLLPAFIYQNGLRFPVGVADRTLAYDFLQADVSAGPVYFPQLLLIDRKGVIRTQYSGTDEFFKDEEKNLRAQLDAMLKDGSPGVEAKGARK